MIPVKGQMTAGLNIPFAHRELSKGWDESILSIAEELEDQIGPAEVLSQELFDEFANYRNDTVLSSDEIVRLLYKGKLLLNEVKDLKSILQAIILKQPHPNAGVSR